MTKNMGGVDRGIRAAVGVIVILLGVRFKSWWGALGLLPLLTAATGWCPGYLPFGISTRPKVQPGTPAAKP